MMPTVLVLLAHADPSVRSKYEAACARLGARVHVVPFVGPGKGMSSRYDTLGTMLRSAGGGRVLPGLVQRVAPGISYDHLVLAWFSGGYAMGRAMAPADRDELAGMIAIDGLHTGFDADHSASDAGLEWITDYARRARDGRCVCWVGHTDVQTPQDGPGAYASTTQTAAELERLVGPSERGWRVQSFDLRGPTQQAREHGDALHVWGPEWLAGAVAEVLEQRGGAAAPDTPRTGDALGPIALELAIAELANGIREEPPGSNTGRRIREYLTGCERDGKPLSLPSGDWCAAAASWCGWEASRRTTHTPPYRRRVAVRELVADAIAAGAWRPVASGYAPQVGDLAILRRVAGESPERGGRGHVGRVEAVGDGIYVTVDGNSGVAWGRASRRLDDPALVGWIAEPRSDLACAVSSGALALAATLRVRGDEAAEWLGSLV